eukprot:1156910-Pelagomonas_calceolata.AAC.4
MHNPGRALARPAMHNPGGLQHARAHSVAASATANHTWGTWDSSGYRNIARPRILGSFLSNDMP